MSRQAAAAKLMGFGLRSLKPIQSSSSSQSRHLSACSLPRLNLEYRKEKFEKWRAEYEAKYGIQVNNEIPSESMEERFERWMVKFGRVYKDDAEKQRRFKIFKENAEYIDYFNMNRDGSMRLGTNDFADWTKEEREKLAGCTRGNRLRAGRSFRF